MLVDLKTLSYGKSESLSSIEDLIQKVQGKEKYKLRLPSKLYSLGALGVEASVLQLLGTWLKSGDYPKIFHSHQQPTPEDFSKLCTSIYGIAALSLVDEVWDTTKVKQPRSMVLNEAKLIVENIRNKKFSTSFKSRYFGIPCIKKPTYDREFEMPIYNNNQVIEGGAFYNLVSKIMEDTISGKMRFNRLDQNIGLQDLSDLLWELFKNTHDHGRCNVGGDDLELNFRSLIIQQQDISRKYLDEWCGEKPSQAQLDFCEHLPKSSFYDGTPESDKYHILDVSVTDFGEGFIELAMNKAKGKNPEDVLLKCLESGWSRLSNRTRGDGLTKVLEKVNRYKGWLRIRTGNLLLEKAFTGNQNVQITHSDIKVLNHSVVGTSVHISIPLQPETTTEGGH